jgi:hypothetical protein
MPRGSISGTRSAPRVTPPPDWPNRVPKSPRPSAGEAHDGDDRGGKEAKRSERERKYPIRTKDWRAKLADLISPD